MSGLPIDHAALRSAAAATVLPGFEGTVLPEWLRARLAAGLGGVCVFGENIRSLDQLRELTAAIREANPLAIIAIDEEGGDVTRLFYEIGSPYPGNAVLGRIDDLVQTGTVARTVGLALRDAGVTLDFAPDADINSNPDNPVIGVRSFGSTASHVAEHAAAWVRGLQSAGVAASAKHFPGHGETATDSHRALPVVDVSLEVLRSRELVPFAAAIDAGVRTIMTSHILLPQLDAEHPATLSPRILQGLLRTELGFTGLIVSDALDMAGASGAIGIPEAAVQALGAGCDLLCIGTKNTDAQLADIERAVLAAVADGRLTETRVLRAAAAVRALGAESGPPGDSRPVSLPSATVERISPLPGPDQVATTFDITPEAELWLRNGPTRVIVRLETVPNEAVGSAPWGPFAHLDEWSADDVITVTETSASPQFSGTSIVVVGKANHLHPWATHLIDTLRRD
ncbi:MAG: hypothetical protein JWQ64_543, partial [Subtercola sp.]|nr:hypothetical protein [Subtercola sp.]